MADQIVWKVMPGSDEIEQIRVASETFDGVSQMLPGGSYTTFRTYNSTRVVRFCDHINRLHTTAKLIERNNFPMDQEKIRRVLHKVISLFPGEEHRFRITVDLDITPGTVFIAREKLSPLPFSLYQQGVRTVTHHIHRTNPKAKLTHFLSSASSIRSQLPDGVHEALMVSEGRILEGISSNFFAIRDGIIWTAEEGVLLGVTRSVVLDEIRTENIPIQLWPITLDDIPYIQEAFITSSSRGILPVVMIDDQQIGNGTPGPITMRLHRRYLDRLEEELEDI
jgi:branched-chain amino acid aminotransferase